MQNQNNFDYNLLEEDGKMRLFGKYPLVFEEKAYEIRVYYSNTKINIVTFLNNYPANGFRHLIQIPKKCDVQNVLKEALLDELIDISKNEIIQQRWNKFSEIIQRNTRDVHV